MQRLECRYSERLAEHKGNTEGVRTTPGYSMFAHEITTERRWMERLFSSRFVLYIPSRSNPTCRRWHNGYAGQRYQWARSPPKGLRTSICR